MSSFRKALLGAALAVTVATPALAQNLIGSGEPWELRDRMAYAVNMTGNMRILPIGDRGMTMLMKRAKPVARGTVLFMHNGQLYMTQGGGAFDRAGNWMTNQ
jgi:hypothetical protein